LITDAAPAHSSGTLSGNIPCPVCRESNSVPRSPGKDRLFGLAPGVFPLLRCGSCGCVFQHPLLEDSALAKFYPEEFWWSDEPERGSRLASLLRRLEKTYRERVVADHVRFLDFCARKRTSGGRLLLDIGCGSGTFLHVAETYGFVPHGMDQSGRALEIAGRQYGFPLKRGVVGDPVWEGRRFDFVTMFHVLEHLPNPRLGLEYASRLLQPDGVLVLQVPNVASVQARMFGNFWRGLDVPRHVINFTPKALDCLLREAGFEFRIKTRFSLRDDPAMLASSMAPGLDPTRRPGTSLRSNLFFSAAREMGYFGLFLLAAPAAFLESACGLGASVWACAWKKDPEFRIQNPV